MHPRGYGAQTFALLQGIGRQTYQHLTTSQTRGVRFGRWLKAHWSLPVKVVLCKAGKTGAHVAMQPLGDSENTGSLAGIQTCFGPGIGFLEEPRAVVALGGLKAARCQRVQGSEIVLKNGVDVVDEASKGVVVTRLQVGE